MKSFAIFITRFVALAIVGVLVTTNAYAYLASTSLDYRVQLTPTDPNGEMSLTWSLYDADASVYARHDTSNERIENIAFDYIKQPINMTVAVETNHTGFEAGTYENGNIFTVTFDERIGVKPDDVIRQYCVGEYQLRRKFTIEGEGWVSISSLHSAEYEPTTRFHYKSNAGMALSNYSPTNRNRDYEQHALYYGSPDLAGSFGTRLFFADGEKGRFTLYSDDRFWYNTEVPIPGAIWLFSSGLILIAAGRRARQ